MKLIYNCTCIIACLAIMSCHKDKNTTDNNAVKQLTVADAGSTASVSTGQTISLTLGNPGDGGYQFNNPQYNTSVLTLLGHTHQNGTNATGDFGTDTWKFTANGSGTTTLEVTASRAGQASQTLSLFANQIIVK